MWVSPRRSSPSGCHAVWMSLLIPAVDNSWFKANHGLSGPIGCSRGPQVRLTRRPEAGTDMPTSIGCSAWSCSSSRPAAPAPGRSSAVPMPNRDRITTSPSRSTRTRFARTPTMPTLASPWNGQSSGRPPRISRTRDGWTPPASSIRHWSNYELALELNPTSADIEEALRSVRTQLRTKVAVAREGKTELQTLIERTRDLPPPGLDLPANVTMPASLVFRDAGSRDVYLTIARFGNLSLGFDPAFRDARLTVDLRNTTLEGSLRAVSEATQNFYRVTGQRSVLIIPDTPAKRREYEDEVVRTFYLSNADLKETMDLLRMVLDARRVSPDHGHQRGHGEGHAGAHGRRVTGDHGHRQGQAGSDHRRRTARGRSDEAQGVRAAVRLAWVARPRRFDRSGEFDRCTLQALRNLTQADVLLANLPSLYYRLLKTDTNTRTLANPQLRTSEGMAAQARFGERIPGAGDHLRADRHWRHGAAADRLVQLREHRRQHRHHPAHASRRRCLADAEGRGAEPLGNRLWQACRPSANREISTVIRLRDGETNMLAGLIRDDERRVIEGIPGLIDLPVIGASLRAHASGDDTDRHHPDADAPHHPRPGSGRKRSGRVQGRARYGLSDRAAAVVPGPAAASTGHRAAAGADATLRPAGAAPGLPGHRSAGAGRPAAAGRIVSPAAPLTRRAPSTDRRAARSRVQPSPAA